MENRTIDFKKSRDFGEILSDTFLFLKLEFKPLFRILLIYAAPFILIYSLLSGYYESGGMREFLGLSTHDPFAFFSWIFSIDFLLVVFARIASNTVIIVTLFSFIHLYVTKGKGTFDQYDVKQHLLKKFLPTFGGFFIIILLSLIALFFCLVPSLYVLTVFSLVIPILIFTDKGLGGAIERSNSLIRNHFWFTLGIGIVITIITYFIAIYTSSPIIIVSAIYSYMTVSGEANSESFKLIIMILSIIAKFFSSFVFVIPNTAMALHYFSQIEKKESPGLLEKINQINQPDEPEDSNYY